MQTMKTLLLGIFLSLSTFNVLDNLPTIILINGVPHLVILSEDAYVVEVIQRVPYYFTSALTHASLADARVNSNERLEFLGDSILGMVVCHELYHRFPDYLEGELTKIKSAVVSRRTCAQISRRLGLTKFLFLGKVR